MAWATSATLFLCPATCPPLLVLGQRALRSPRAYFHSSIRAKTKIIKEIFVTRLAFVQTRIRHDCGEEKVHSSRTKNFEHNITFGGFWNGLLLRHDLPVDLTCPSSNPPLAFLGQSALQSPRTCFQHASKDKDHQEDLRQALGLNSNACSKPWWRGEGAKL